MTAAVALAVGLAPVATAADAAQPQAAPAVPKAKVMVVAHGQVKSVARATHLTNTQVTNARTIVSVVVNQKLPPRAAVVALAAAMQESSLHDRSYGDRDSLGLFQERPSMGWGTPAQVTDPKYATRKFLHVLKKVPDWQKLPVTQAAQAVERSAYPKAYAKWAPLAKKLVDSILVSPPATPAAPAAPTKDPTVPANASYAPPSNCTLLRPRRGVSTRP